MIAPLAKALVLSCAILAIGGCKTLGGGEKTTMVTIISEPGDALVTVDGFGECQTPCTVEIDKPRTVTVAKAGYDQQKLTLQPGKRQIIVRLALSAPTTGVDETQLPEL